MSDLDQMKKLKQRYVELVKKYGEEVTEFKSFRESLLKLNQKHRADAIEMYTKIISKIENGLNQRRRV